MEPNKVDLQDASLAAAIEVENWLKGVKIETRATRDFFAALCDDQNSGDITSKSLFGSDPRVMALCGNAMTNYNDSEPLSTVEELSEQLKKMAKEIGSNPKEARTFFLEKVRDFLLAVHSELSAQSYTNIMEVSQSHDGSTALPRLP